MSFAIYGVICVTILRELNGIVYEPYMDEPFHVPQAQAYCRGDFQTWDPKITTPPGLYILSYILKRIFMFKCNLPMLRLTPMLSSLALPLVLSRLLYVNRRIPAPASSFFSPIPESIVIASFPIAWFFGFLYYTELPSLVSVVWIIVAASLGRHWEAALAGLISCTFRQTNIIWLLYGYAISQVMYLRYRRGTFNSELHDPPADTATPSDFIRMVKTFPTVLPDILPNFAPYAAVTSIFAAFVVWNGGIVLGDKSNHIPSLHIPQLYYFYGFTTMFAWPVLVSAPGGFKNLVCEVYRRMFGSARRSLVTAVITGVMCITVHLFTIHHPFLLSDNRHYTFYVWRRVFMFHPLVPYLLVPGYIACAWVWFLRLASSQTLAQSIALPLFILPTLLPTPLLEPRYFLIPYVLLRSQVVDVPAWGITLEGVWYAVINAITMYVFLYKEREGVGRFMW